MLSLSPLVIFMAVAGVYLLPGIVAVLRGKRHQWQILLLDVVLGWTLVGWAGALWWALSSDKPLVRAAKSAVAPRARPAQPVTEPRDSDIHANDNASERTATASRFVWDDTMIVETAPDAYSDWLDSGAAVAAQHERQPAAPQHGHGVAA